MRTIAPIAGALEVLGLLLSATGCTAPVRVEANVPGTSVVQTRAAHVPEVPVPEPPEVDGPKQIFTNTSHVQSIASNGSLLWAATRGGLELYDARTRRRLRLYTTRDGLASTFVEGVVWGDDGTLSVSTAAHVCRMHEASGRFSCALRGPNVADRDPNVAKPAVPAAESIEGAPVTCRWTSADGGEWLGTAGLGLWVRDRRGLTRVSPNDQVGGNHIVAISEWGDSSWFASFDQGLSRWRSNRFSAVPIGSRMLNDLAATSDGLFIATADGLYLTKDGESFERESRVTERPINDLAYDARSHVLYATANNSLWEIALGASRARPRATYQPGGSTSLQAVDVGSDGTVFLASEDRGVLRRVGKSRGFVGFDRLAGYPSSWATDVIALDQANALVGTLRHGAYPLFGANPISVPIDPWILFLGRDYTAPEILYVGTQNGALVLEKDHSHQLAGLPHPCVHAIAHLSSGLWVGTEGGLAWYD